MSEVRQLDVTIMGREFRLSCPANEEATLLQAVELLDQKMHDIRAAGRLVGIEKIAIMAALNIAHDYLHTGVTGGLDLATVQRRITDMKTTIDHALQGQSDLF